MTGFADYETSDYDGVPAEIVDIVYGPNPGDVVRLTSADYFHTVGGNTYTPGYFERDSVTNDTNPYDSEQITLKLKRGNAFETIRREQDFTIKPMIMVQEVHLADPAAGTRLIWNGRLTGVSFERLTMNVGTERLSTYMKRQALSMKYQAGQCVNVLYRGLCFLNKPDWEVTGTINTVTSGTEIDITEAAAFPDGYFLGGILIVDGINRWIVGHAGSTIFIDRSAFAAVAAAGVSLYPGCDRLKATCDDRFGNGIHYLAFDWMPPSGPFDGATLN